MITEKVRTGSSTGLAEEEDILAHCHTKRNELERRLCRGTSCIRYNSQSDSYAAVHPEHRTLDPVESGLGSQIEDDSVLPVQPFLAIRTIYIAPYATE